MPRPSPLSPWLCSLCLAFAANGAIAQSAPRAAPPASLSEGEEIIPADQVFEPKGPPALNPSPAGPTLSFPVETPEPDPNAPARPAMLPPTLAPGPGPGPGGEPEASSPETPSFFEGAWNGFAFSPDAAQSRGPLSACQSRVSAAEGQARARAGSMDLGALISSDQGWRLSAQSEGQSWVWSKAPDAGASRVALSGPGLSCALARPSDFRAALAAARALEIAPVAGALSLIGFEVKSGSIGRPCAALLSNDGALIRVGETPAISLPAERLSFERPTAPSSASTLFYRGASARLSGPPTQRLAALFAAPAESFSGVSCQLASPSWWDGMAPAAEPP